MNAQKATILNLIASMPDPEEFESCHPSMEDVSRSWGACSSLETPPNYARIVSVEEAERGEPEKWKRYARGMSPGYY